MGNRRSSKLRFTLISLAALLAPPLVGAANLAVPRAALAQSKANDIPVASLPAGVKAVLDQYLKTLRTSENLAACAKSFVSIAGGGLVKEDGTLRDTIMPYSLKKDFENIKHYADPTVITRVSATDSNGSGYGATAIKGKAYKIWVAKKEGTAGLPAPVIILVPEGHATIKTPKVVGIGSF